MEIQVITNRCFGLFIRINVSISKNRTKIERLLDWKDFPSKSVGRFSFQCLTAYASKFYFLRKRATEEFRKKEDYRHKREVEERLRKNFETSLLGVGSVGPRAQSAPGTSKGKKEAPRK